MPALDARFLGDLFDLELARRCQLDACPCVGARQIIGALGLLLIRAPFVNNRRTTDVVDLFVRCLRQLPQRRQSERQVPL